MQNILPIDIPPSGVRYDMTLEKVGYDIVSDENVRRRKYIARYIIDNGRYKGKRVSREIDRDTALMLRDSIRKQRVSAVLHVTATAMIDGCRKPFDPETPPEGARDYVYRYNLTDFAPPQAPSELKQLLDRSEKFRRI